MKIYLLCNKLDMVLAWKMYFQNEENVSVVFDKFDNFMCTYKVDCIVSPANSFGLMDGGYDEAITTLFGDELQKSVQKYILENYYGEQPVGSSFIIETPVKGIKLIHTPTMRVPEKIYDDAVIYTCTRTCLMTALENNIESIVIPAFGEATGKVSCDNVAGMMWMAYNQIFHGKREISWENAIKTHYRETYAEI